MLLYNVLFIKENGITVFTKSQWCHSGIILLCSKCPTCQNFILKPKLFGYVLVIVWLRTYQSVKYGLHSIPGYHRLKIFSSPYIQASTMAM